MNKNERKLQPYDNGRFTEWHFKHDSGLVFEVDYLATQDISIILLHAIEDEDEPVEGSGLYMVDYIFGQVEDQLDDDIDYYINRWLATKDEDFVKSAIRRQKKYEY